MTPALRAYIKGWLEKAENDIISAQRMLEIEPMILESACFHCQQAIEKCLKAFLAFHGQEIERTHNIIFLLSECSNYDPIFTDIDPGNINQYAVQGRYPDSNLMPSTEEAKGFLELALQVKEFVVERLVFS